MRQSLGMGSTYQAAGLQEMLRITVIEELKTNEYFGGI